MRIFKYVATFIGGTIVGVISGGLFVVMKAFKSERIRASIADVISTKISSVIYGEDVQVSKRQSSGLSYHRYYSQGPSHRSSYNFDSMDITFESRMVADEVLTNLNDIIKEYGVASVYDFKILSDVAGDPVDHKYGWADIRNARIARVRAGYSLQLPRTILID